MKHRIHLSKEVAKHMREFGRMFIHDAPSKAEETDKIEPTEAEKPADTQPAVQEAPEQEHADSDAPFTVVTRTHVGKVRATNQDAVIECGRLVGVADGMGGHQGGETASAGARDGLIANLQDVSPDPAVLSRAIKAVNRRLFIQAQENDKLRGMGTTLSVLWLGDECAYIGHVGDSRVYRLRQGEFKQITEDHSVVMELMRSGMITQEQAASHPMRNVITRAVGTEGGVDVDMLAVEREKGDLWLICSDGLHGLVRDQEMAEMLQHNPPEKAADLLLQAALDAGGRDNISLVILADKEGAQ